MPRTPKLLAMSGSLRKASVNTRLLRIAISAAEEAGAEVDHCDLKALDLPMYDGDLEEQHGLPDSCLELKRRMKAADGFLFACPEHNSSITPAWKNAIDWASRPMEGESALECFDGKTAGLLAASPGALGGLRGLVEVRRILGNIRVHVHPTQYAAGSIAYDDNDMPTDDAHAKGARNVAQQLVEFTRRQIG
jgi:chromate reductase, NAD(P)H dehydrogenase (quinone)